MRISEDIEPPIIDFRESKRQASVIYDILLKHYPNVSVTCAYSMFAMHGGVIGYEYHRVRIYGNLIGDDLPVDNGINKMSQMLKQLGIEHEYSTDEFNRPTLYVPHSQKALR